ncbi:MAG: hypothetical protein A2498_07805 [Lentisphaerae bacterium RIFOXYC12_FULL_60_16]|nr:MAG: hypothetical protein A2498_07805 [Lentisphaerae bacterium RIFOXYC12_FULL_60_16]OGV86238.1 MAG: hypothetical protein A2340_13735 [Lentisphaerae bacterium RIFOXYB12_FULL_60_10]
MKKVFAEIEISTIKTRTPLLRDTLGDLATLEGSIRKFGLLAPLVVDASDTLIAGARRLEACKRAGLARVPVWKLDVPYSSLQALDVQTDENLCREPLSATELSRHIRDKKRTLKPRLPRWIQSIIEWFQRLFHRPTKAR